MAVDAIDVRGLRPQPVDFIGRDESFGVAFGVLTVSKQRIRCLGIRVLIGSIQ